MGEAMKPSEIVKKLNEDVVAINLASMFGGMPQSYQERATCYKAAADLIEGLIPRPIEEAPMDKYFITMNDSLVKIGLYNSRLNRVLSDNSIYLTEAKSFIPLSAIQKLMESGE